VVFPGEPGTHGESMSKESKPNITRRNVLAGIGASGVGLALGAHGVAAGEKNYDDKYDVPVAIDWQESFHKHKGAGMMLEAFPDDDNDAVQDDDIDYCDGGMMSDPLIDVEDPLSSDRRTNNDYTESGDPLINFHGVKPGYGGEVTLSYHVCDQPGKVKLKAKDVHVDKKLAHLARARVWYDEFDGATPPNGGNNGPVNGTYPVVTGPVTEATPQIDEIIVTGDDPRFPEPGARNYDCDDYEDRLDRFDDNDLEGDELFGSDLEAGDTATGNCGTITVDATGSGSVTLSSDDAVLIVSVKGGNEGEQVYVFEEPVILDGATFSTPTGQAISNIDVCCLENGNGGNGGNGDNGRGDNVYQPYEPIIAQGSLKKVLRKLKKGVHVSGDPYVAGPFDREGVHYYAYPRENTSSMETPPAEMYDPGWVTDDNVDEYVHEKKVKELKHLDGVELCIDGTGYVARNEDKPLPELCIEVKKIIKGKKGKPVGFKWESNLPICRIEIASGEHTKLNVYDRATEGTALAPRYGKHDHDGCGCDDHEDGKKGHEKHRRRPMTGIRFGVCDNHDEDDWCIENSNTGYIGFEWWVPKHVNLKGKRKFESNFDFKAKPCKKDDNGNGDNGRREISFVAFCVDEDDIDSGDSFDDFDIDVNDTNNDDEPVGIEWDSGGIPVQTVVLFGGGDWFNYDVDGATMGDNEMGQPGEGNQRTGQTQSAPCAFDGDYCSVKFNQSGGNFTADDPMDSCF